jgi:CDP-diacylglycerol--glycerol-3-phosphate 3-phosphatidyltransferase
MAYPPRSELNPPHSLEQLQRQWALLAALAGFSTLAVGAALWSSEHALRWGLISGVVLVYQFIFTRRRLAANHRVGEVELLPTFGAGSVLTILRGVFIAWTAGFLFSPRPVSLIAWAPVVLYTAAIILDLVDGYAARVVNKATELGSALDTELDALGLLVAISLAVWYGALPVWFLPIGAARYAFMFGIWLRQRQGLPVYPLPESTSRRPIAGLTMGFTSAMLWPIVFQPGTTLAGLIFLAPFAAGFTRDWLVVSGALDPKSARYLRWRRDLRLILLQWFPLAMRISLVLALSAMILTWLDLLGGPYVAAPLPDTFTVLLLVLGTLMIALGLAGRIAAFLMIFPLSFTIIDVGLRPVLTMMLLAVLAILLLGTGALSLWKPEKRIFGRRWGGG